MLGDLSVFGVRKLGWLGPLLCIGSIAPGCTLLRDEFQPTLSNPGAVDPASDAGTQTPGAQPGACDTPDRLSLGADGVCTDPLPFLPPDAGEGSVVDGGDTGPAAGTGPCLAGLAEFGAPERITGLGVDAQLFGPSLSADGLTLYFAAVTGEIEHIYTATRDEPSTSRFSNAIELTATSSMGRDGTPFISFDGRSIYFFSDRMGGAGSRDVWRSRRQNDRSPFDAPSELSALNTPELELSPWLTRDELTVLFASSRPGGSGGTDIWTSTRDNDAVSFPAPTNAATLNTVNDEGRVVLTSDARTAIFSSDRAGGLGYPDLWMATRPDPTSPFGPAQNLTQQNSADADQDVALSRDDRELFFASSRTGIDEIWRSTRGCL